MSRSSRNQIASRSPGQQNKRPEVAHPTDNVFVGRERELAELRGYLEAAFTGNGRLVLVVGEPGIGKTRLSYALPDRHAKAVYQRRLEDLRYELEEAEQLGDSFRLSKAQAEIESLTNELAAAYGIGTLARKNGGEVEKARKAVANRIRTALGKVKQVHPLLWRHLFTALKTGTFCSYTPEKPVTWQV
jgi:predicted ATPase